MYEMDVYDKNQVYCYFLPDTCVPYGKSWMIRSLKKASLDDAPPRLRVP